MIIRLRVEISDDVRRAIQHHCIGDGKLASRDRVKDEIGYAAGYQFMHYMEEAGLEVDWLIKVD